MVLDWRRRHQVHLIKQKQLARHKDYYSFLGMFANVARSTHMPAAIKKAYAEITSQEEAKRKVNRYVPRPLRGRWGAIASTEEWYMNAGFERVAAVINKVLPKEASRVLAAATLVPARKAKAKAKAKPKPNSQPTGPVDLDAADAPPAEDADFADESKVYTEKMGQWRTKTVINCNNPDKWRMIIVMNKAFGPCTHCERFFMSGGTAMRTSKMAEFVTSRCAQIQREFDDLLSDGAFEADWQVLVELTPDELKLADWVEEGVAQTLEVATNFYQRFTVPVQDFPRRLAWLIVRPPGIPCLHRQRIAGQLVSFGRQHPDHMTSNLCDVFAHELGAASASGCICPHLHEFVNQIFLMWMCDTQEIEGANNIIKYIYKLSPKIAWPLLASRLLAKKTLANYPGASDLDFFIDACRDNHEAAVTYNELHPQRFADSGLATYPMADYTAEALSAKKALSCLHLNAMTSVTLITGLPRVD